MFITINVSDLDRLTHALLMAKSDYLMKSLDMTGPAWRNANANLDALNEAYKQINAALEMVEG